MGVEKLDIVAPGNKACFIVIGPDGPHRTQQGRVVVYFSEDRATQVYELLTNGT